MRRAGLRVRVTAGFAAGTFALSTLAAAVSYQITRQSLVSQSERTNVRAAVYDGTVVQAGLGVQRPDIIGLLRTLDTGENRRAVLLHDGVWYARSADPALADTIPAALRAQAAQGHAVVQRVRVDGVSSLVVALPLDAGSVFYEIDSLAELQRTLTLLRLVLSLVALGTALLGALLGGYASRYVLRPLIRVADAAHQIAGGHSQARLDPANEPDLARLTTSFNHMVDELSARNERDRRFAADVSHELRSPLQTLAAAASVLARRREHLDERTATAAGLVADEVERFQRLVDDLLELARSDRPAVRSPVDVAELGRQLCRARQLDGEIVSVTGDATWTVDRKRVGRLLENLLDNAAAYGGGATALRFSRLGDLGVIEVDDEGPGVSPEDKPVIFDRFVRGRSATSRANGAGTGLGLALVAQHAAAHGGAAIVLDRPGGGARFRAELTGCAP